MDDTALNIKYYIENVFSMPFDFFVKTLNGEVHFLCFPHNDSEALFSVEAYIHNDIRIKCHIAPQLHAAEMIREMSKASKEMQALFFTYLNMLRRKGAKVKFLVNSKELNENFWPEDWKTFSCDINKIPLTDDNDWANHTDVICEWIKHSVNLMISLLTIKEVEPYSSDVVAEPMMSQTEGNKYSVIVNKYERSSINRELCLEMKGYSCNICGFNFKEKYGSIGKQFIEVHHIVPVSQIGPGYKINIEHDLIPVCSNCHSMIHKKTPPFAPSELKDMITSSIKDVIMAITYSSNIETVISLGKIAFGVKKELLDSLAIQNIKYVLLHNWQNEGAVLLKVHEIPKLVSQDSVTEDYYVKYKNEAEMFLLVSFDKGTNYFDVRNNDILHLQPRDKSLRYNLRFISHKELKIVS